MSVYRDWLLNVARGDSRGSHRRNILANLLRRRAGVVLVAPGDVPGERNTDETDKDDGGVVDGSGGDGEVGGHAEEGDCEEGPGYDTSELAQLAQGYEKSEGRGKKDRRRERQKRQEKERHTNSNPIAEPPQLAQRELGPNDMLPPLNHRHGNWHRVRDGQTDNADARERVKRSRRTKVNNAQQDLDDHGQHHGVKRQVQTGMHLLPPLGSRDRTVTSKRPRAARGGRGAGGAAEDAEDHEGDEQADGANGRADGALQDGGDGLTRGQGDEHGDVGKHKHERDHEHQAADGVDDDGDDHGLGHLGRGPLDFLAHGDDHARGRGGVAGVQEADAEGPALGPARGRLEVAEGVGAGAAAFLGDDEDGDEDADEADEGPDDREGLEFLLVTGTDFIRKVKTYIQKRQDLVTQRRDGVTQQGDSQKHQEDLVRLGLPDIRAVLLLEDIDARDKEQRRTKVDRQRNRDVSNNIRPPADIRRHSPVLGGRNHERLIIHAARRGIDRGDFAERRSNAEDDGRDNDPAPDDHDRTAVLQRVVQRGGQAVGNRGQHERHESHVPC